MPPHKSGHKGDMHAPEESDRAIVSMNQTNKKRAIFGGVWGEKARGKAKRGSEEGSLTLVGMTIGEMGASVGCGLA